VALPAETARTEHEAWHDAKRGSMQGTVIESALALAVSPAYTATHHCTRKQTLRGIGLPGASDGWANIRM